MKNRQTIFISAYPKSGSTWLTRLLADVLNSPTGGSMPKEDKKEIATEGQNRPGKYIIRKGHFTLIWTDSDKVIPRPHKLNWHKLTNELIVFLHRDPRDICISGAYHWRVRPEQFLNRMIKGDVAKCGRWDEYCNEWLEFDGVTFEANYEDLLKDTMNEIKTCLSYLGTEMLYDNWIKQAINRQSFKKRSKGLTETQMRRNNMRKGIVGDWHNYFTVEMHHKIWHEFGWMMERLGYKYE